MMGETVARNM